ncbi:19992_t:CDS:2, partial [Entrophospora sp. SA101]
LVEDKKTVKLIGSLFKNSRRISKSFDEADVDMFSDLLVKN